MNPDHFHLEFYEDDNGTMPVLTWLNRLESDDDMAKHDAIVYGLQVILAREGAGVCGTEFGRTLGKGLYESATTYPRRADVTGPGDHVEWSDRAAKSQYQ